MRFPVWTESFRNFLFGLITASTSEFCVSGKKFREIYTFSKLNDRKFSDSLTQATITREAYKHLRNFILGTERTDKKFFNFWL